MATKNGTLVLIKVGTDLLIGQSSLSYSKTANMIETSSKTSGKHADFISGRISSTVSVSGIASTNPEATNAGYWELNEALEAGTPVTITFTEYSASDGVTKVAGANQVSVSALVSSLSLEAPDDAPNTFSADFQITGAETVTTNA